MIELTEEAARYELKFVGMPSDEAVLQHWLRTHPAGFRVAYPPRRVSNVYFDSRSLTAYQENLAGTSRRMKYRLRWYGATRRPDSGKLEIKIRRNRLGWKETAPIRDLPDFGAARWDEIVRVIRRQLPPDLIPGFDFYSEPVLITGYRRRYFVSVDHQARVTFDTSYRVLDQRGRVRPNLRLEALAATPLVVEVKFAYRDLKVGREAIRDLPLRVSRNSKYTLGIEATL